MTDLITSKDALKATQDNQLIEACYSMTLNEKRLLLFGISKINPSTFPDPSKPFKFEMNAKDWREQFGGENPYLMLTRASEKLMGRTLTLHEKVRNSAVPDKTVMQWFDTVEYYEKQSRIVVSFGRGVQVRLAGMLEQFTTIDLLAISQLSSTHAVRLYELLSQFKSTGYRVMTLGDFRFAMDCVNTNKGTKELKRAVLNPSIKQLNEKSDLFCIVQDIKEGRTITGFKFSFKTQEQKKLF
ncbi:MAG: replication initiation protein [Porticoccaceae bacterium]|nr:replication initiation protein [Porticoccaceae bacterium]